MCLEIVVLFPRGAKRPIDPGKLASSPGLCVSAKRTDDGREALYFTGAGGCGCDLMVDGGSHRQGSTGWRFAEASVPQLAAAVVAIGKKSGGFSFRAEWLGIDGRRGIREPVSVPALVADIRNNRVQNGVEYVVAG